MCGDGRVRQEDREGGHALIQVVEKASHFLEKVLADLVSVKAAGGRQDSQPRQRGSEVDLALKIDKRRFMFRGGREAVKQDKQGGGGRSASLSLAEARLRWLNGSGLIVSEGKEGIGMLKLVRGGVVVRAIKVESRAEAGQFRDGLHCCILFPPHIYTFPTTASSLTESPQVLRKLRVSFSIMGTYDLSLAVRRP